MNKKRKVACVILKPDGMNFYYDMILFKICASLRFGGYCANIKWVKADCIAECKDIAREYDLIFGVFHFDGKACFEAFYKTVKTLNSEIRICIVKSYHSYRGCYVTNDIETLMLNHNIDFIIEENCENNAIYLCEKLGSINGKMIQCDKSMFSDINDIPSTVDLQVESKMREIVLTGSYGCDGKCSFCNNPQKIQLLEVENIVEEIEYAYKKYGIHMFGFVDSSLDGMSSDQSRLAQLIDCLKEKKLPVSISANFKVNSYKKLSDKQMQDLTEVGLVDVFLGCESFNNEDLQIYRKMWNVEDNLEAIARFQSYGIHVDIGLININPYSTIEKLKINNHYIKKLGYGCVMPQLHRLKIYPNTDIFQKIKSDNLLYDNYVTPYDYSFVDESVQRLSDFMKKEIFVNKTYRQVERDLYYLCRKFVETQYHYRKILIATESSKLQLFDELIEKYNDERDKISLYVCDWFGGLLTDIEKNTDIKTVKFKTKDVFECLRNLTGGLKILKFHIIKTCGGVIYK